MTQPDLKDQSLSPSEVFINIIAPKAIAIVKQMNLTSSHNPQHAEALNNGEIEVAVEKVVPVDKPEPVRQWRPYDPGKDKDNPNTQTIIVVGQHVHGDMNGNRSFGSSTPLNLHELGLDENEIWAVEAYWQQTH